MKSYLVFSAEERLYAIDSQFVREATLPSEVTKLPYAKKHVIGMSNLRGDIYPVVYPWSSGFSLDKAASGKQILVETPKTTFLLHVEKIVDSMNVQSESIEKPGESSTTTTSRNLFEGRFKSRHGLVEILSPNLLIDNLE